jgi:hypothetical protein
LKKTINYKQNTWCIKVCNFVTKCCKTHLQLAYSNPKIFYARYRSPSGKKENKGRGRGRGREEEKREGGRDSGGGTREGRGGKGKQRVGEEKGKGKGEGGNVVPQLENCGCAPALKT